MMRRKPGIKPILLRNDKARDLHWSLSQSWTIAPGTGLKVTSNFFTPANALLLGPKLLSIVDEQRAYVLFKRHCYRDKIEPAWDDLEHFFAKQLRVEYELLSMPFEDLRMKLTPAREAVRLALYMVTQPVTTISSSAAFTHSMVAQLKEALERSDLSSSWAPTCELLLWVLFIGAQFSQRCAEWPWFVSHVSRTSKALGLVSCSQMREVLLGFYYFEEYCDGTLVAVWPTCQSERIEGVDNAQEWVQNRK